MKPDNNFPPFHADAIPLRLLPDLWDETKILKYRGLKFIALYTLSMAINFLLVFIPIGIYVYFGRINGLHMVVATIKWWLIISTPCGVLMGLAVWWDFTRECRKLAKEKLTNDSKPPGFQ